MKEGDFYEAHIAYRLVLIHSTCIWAVSYPRKHTNCTISLQEWHFATPLRHTEKQQFYWNWETLPLQRSSLQPPKFNVDKSTQWLGQRGPTTFDLRAILQKRGNFRATSNKIIYETTDSRVLKLKGRKCVQTSNEFLVRYLSVWEIYIFWIMSRNCLQSLKTLLCTFLLKGVMLDIIKITQL